MHYIYIIYSQKADRFYIVESFDPQHRLEEHNSHVFKGTSTVIADDWAIQLILQVANRTEGRKVEQYIKNMKSRKFIEQLISDNSFREKFKSLVKEKFNIVVI